MNRDLINPEGPSRNVPNITPPFCLITFGYGISTSTAHTEPRGTVPNNISHYLYLNKGQEKIDETNTSKKGRNSLKGKRKGGSSSRGDKEDIKGKRIMVERENETDEEINYEIKDKIDDEAKDELEDNAEDDTESKIEAKSNNDNSSFMDKLRRLICCNFN